MPLILQVSISDAMRRPGDATFVVTSEERILAIEAIGHIRFSTLLESISTRPSVWKVCSPSHWLWMQISFSPSRDLAEIFRRYA